MKLKIICISLIIVVFSLPSICFSEQPDSKEWEYFQPRFYYNKTNLIKSSDIISVWVYEIITDIQRKEMIEIVKKESLDKSKKYQNYEYKMMLWKIDCKNRQGKREKTIYYDDKGKVLDQYSYKNSEWESIPPESILEVLYKRLCVPEKKSYVVLPRVKNRDNNDWVEYGRNKDGNLCSYKLGNIEKNKGKYVVQVWDKMVLSDKGKEELIQLRTQGGLSTEGWDKVLEIKSLYDIDCSKRKVRTISHYCYDTDGKVLGYDDFDKSEWVYIIPDSHGETLQKKVCK